MGLIFSKPLPSRKNEARTLLKSCFENNVFSSIPFEIWKTIVCFADSRTLTFLAQTCWGFKELFEIAIENNVSYCKSLRGEGQIALGLKNLYRCAENGNSDAMFCIGHAYFNCGWGLKVDWDKGEVDKKLSRLRKWCCYGVARTNIEA